MKLPTTIEHELQAIEAEYASRGGQQAGNPRLRGLRSSIETTLHELGKRFTVEEVYSALATAFPCPHCGAIGYTPILESIDSGTTITCDSCQGKTVIELRGVKDAEDTGTEIKQGSAPQKS